MWKEESSGLALFILDSSADSPDGATAENESSYSDAYVTREDRNISGSFFKSAAQSGPCEVDARIGG